ncbi:MAG: HD domain-containing protein [Candidatus Omnitrophica bacterium]|nr:HD domain-containing protein [Candidatus Omnitrophota bacterium]
MNLRSVLSAVPYLSRISSVLRDKKTEGWLVGGFLRDAFLEISRPLVDFDFCLSSHTGASAREIARRIDGRFLVLDTTNETYRVVKKRRGRVYTYDFSRMRGEDIAEDLARRDFTINMLAVSLTARPRRLVDVHGSRKDLRQGLIRALSAEVFRADPLRILRAYSFMARYSFRIEAITRRVARETGPMLTEVSGERLQEELYKIFAAPTASPAVKLMSEDRVLDHIIPEVSAARGVHQGGYHHLDVWRHSLEAFTKCEQLWKRKFCRHPKISGYLKRTVGAGHSRLQTVKFACLLHDLGKPEAKEITPRRTIFHTHEKIGAGHVENICRRLRISQKETEALKKLVYWHLRPGYLADQHLPSQRALYRFGRDAGEETVAVLVLSLADWRATRGPLVDTKKRQRHERIMVQLIEYYLREKEKKPLPKLLDGHLLMRLFRLRPSPLVGEILRAVEEEQKIGTVSTRDQAEEFAREFIRVRRENGQGGDHARGNTGNPD